MRNSLRLTAVLAALTVSSPAWSAPVVKAANERPRVIMTTDGEGDDQASFYRFLLYSNEFDLEGIVHSSSRFHWAGDPAANPPIADRSWAGLEWTKKNIEEHYVPSYPNLLKHDSRFPSPEKLLSLEKTGNITYVGEMDKNTEGSEWIKKVLLDDKPGPLWLLAWGGTNTIAAALRSIKDEFYGTPQWPAVAAKVNEKAIIYIILDQDATYKNYIVPNWPDVPVIMNNNQFWTFAYNWNTRQPQELRRYFEAPFMRDVIRRGPLLSDYPLNRTTGHWFSEGDSPSFMYLIDTGLSDIHDPTQGNWGGRFVQIGPRLWTDRPSYHGLSGRTVADESPYDEVNTTLAAPAAAGEDTLQVDSTSGLNAGYPLTLSSGAQVMMESASSAMGPGATLFAPAKAGETTLRVNSVAGFAAGRRAYVNTGAGQEVITIAAVGTAGAATMLASEAAAGATNVKVASVDNLAAGDQLTIGNGTGAETVTVKSVGSAGTVGTGVEITPALEAAHSSGSPVRNQSRAGTGLTLASPLENAYALGTPVRGAGTVKLTAPIASPIALGAKVVSKFSPFYPQSRWTPAIQMDMAARGEWTFKSHEDANHQPLVSVAHKQLVVPVGQRVRLQGSATDPDGDTLSYSWWQYREAGTYPGAIVLNGAAQPVADFVVPADAQPGQKIHVVFEVRDSGTLPMTRYQRVIVTVGPSASREVGTLVLIR